MRKCASMGARGTRCLSCMPQGSLRPSTAVHWKASAVRPFPRPNNAVRASAIAVGIGRAYLCTMSETVTSIRLTPAAAARVAKIAARQSAPAILRLSVEGGGCAGFSYKFGLATAPEADDLVTETDGVKLVIDPTSLDLQIGRAHV